MPEGIYWIKRVKVDLKGSQKIFSKKFQEQFAFCQMKYAKDKESMPTSKSDYVRV